MHVEQCYRIIIKIALIIIYDSASFSRTLWREHIFSIPNYSFLLNSFLFAMPAIFVECKGTPVWNIFIIVVYTRVCALHIILILLLLILGFDSENSLFNNILSTNKTPNKRILTERSQWLWNQMVNRQLLGNVIIILEKIMDDGVRGKSEPARVKINNKFTN